LTGFGSAIFFSVTGFDFSTRVFTEDFFNSTVLPSGCFALVLLVSALIGLFGLAPFVWPLSEDFVAICFPIGGFAGPFDALCLDGLACAADFPFEAFSELRRFGFALTDALPEGFKGARAPCLTFGAGFDALFFVGLAAAFVGFALTGRAAFLPGAFAATFFGAVGAALTPLPDLDEVAFFAWPAGLVPDLADDLDTGLAAAFEFDF